jgi:hypothetical protein
MKTLSVRLPDDLAQDLNERKLRDSLNVSAFVVRALRNEFERGSQTVRPRSAAPVLFTPVKETR